ncbi:GTP cyclohydrolase FolE2 [Gammaproteobacteria bacterium]|nr:GTP cyclohydrolase FolE2 [Gammaproteobacteria bacterium]
MSEPVSISINTMPDIANKELPEEQGTLDWVGMSDVHQPLKVKDGDDLKEVQAKVQVYVNLADPSAKGIHMSRLYLLLDEHSNTRPLTASGLRMLLGSILESHHDLSTNAFVEFSFDHFIRRKALLSENSGWSSYPVAVKGTLINGEVVLELSIEVQYSSTCPCSAALARQLIQSQFECDFGQSGQVDKEDVQAWLGLEESIVATPHSQRSTAKAMVSLGDEVDDLPITDLIDGIEEVLKTPVQSAVKREDEQEFARLNGENLMFVEDAGRRIKKSLQEQSKFDDFWVRIEHHESLHAHDAVGVFTKGRENGYLPIP